MKTLIGIVVAGVVIFALVSWLKPEAADKPAVWQTYTDPSGSVSVTYPPLAEVRTVSAGPTQEWKVGATKANGTLLADIRLPKSFVSGNTNFSDARFTIGRSADADEIRNCTAVQDNFSEREELEIEGYPFVQMDLIEAATGNLYETTSYRGIFDGDCYVIEYTIHSTNIANYPAGDGVEEFDRDGLADTLERMRESVRFLISSD